MTRTEIRSGVSERVNAAITMVQEGAHVGEALNDLLSGAPVEEMVKGGSGEDGPLDDAGDDDQDDSDED